MARLRLTLLGGFEARVDAGPAVAVPLRKAQALLAYLALPLSCPHPRDKVAAMLWGGMPEAQARNGLRQALFSLRAGGVPSPALTVDRETVALAASEVDADVALFESEAAAGTPESLAQAALQYRGDLLAGLSLREPPFEEWLLTERERLRELALEALARLCAHQRAAGDGEAAVRTALKLLALDPLQEHVHRMLMRLYAALGRRGAALRQYQLCADVLQRELRADPEIETRELYRDLLRRQAPRPRALTLIPTAPTEVTSPGDIASASPVVPSGSELVGRESEWAHIDEALDAAWSGRGRTVAVIGEAGIGKSRLLSEAAIEAERRGSRVLLGRAYESDQIVSFGPWVDALQAEIAARGGTEHAERAVAAYRQALALAGTLGMRPTAARCRLGLGSLLRGAGTLGPARAEVARAADALRSMGMALWLPRADAELSELGG